MLHLAAESGRNVLPADRRILIAFPTLTHAGVLSDTLRAGDRAECIAQGVGPYAVIRRSLKGSLWARTFLVDGRVAAMIGLGGVAIGSVGNPWLLTSSAVELVSPRTFLTEARKGLDVMLSIKPHLENHVLASYTKACRLLEVLGFTLDEAAPYGPQGALFRRFWMDA